MLVLRAHTQTHRGRSVARVCLHAWGRGATSFLAVSVSGALPLSHLGLGIFPTHVGASHIVWGSLLRVSISFILTVEGATMGWVGPVLGVLHTASLTFPAPKGLVVLGCSDREDQQTEAGASACGGQQDNVMG